MREEVLVTMIVFTGFYYIIKMFTDYLLKRRIVKSGHVGKADILEPISLQEKEPQRFVTLKWAMVSTMAGAGMIVAYIVGKLYHLGNRDLETSLISFGIELMFIGMGFLLYFLIVSKQKQ